MNNKPAIDFICNNYDKIRNMITREISQKNYDYWQGLKVKRQIIEQQRFEKAGGLTECNTSSYVRRRGMENRLLNCPECGASLGILSLEELCRMIIELYQKHIFVNKPKSIIELRTGAEMVINQINQSTNRKST